MSIDRIMQEENSEGVEITGNSREGEQRGYPAGNYINTKYQLNYNTVHNQSYKDKVISSILDFTKRIDKVLEILPKSQLGGCLGYTHLFSGKMARVEAQLPEMAYMIDTHEAIHTTDEYETRVITDFMLDKSKPRYKIW